MNAANIERYLLPIDRSDWGSLLLEWRPLIPANSSRWRLSKFGELFIEQSDGKIGLLQISAFKYQIVGANKKDFEEWLVDLDKWNEWFFAWLIDRLEASGKNLKPGECYSFIRPLALGGQAVEENVMIILVSHHFRGWGDVFRQTKDLPEGATVVFKAS